MYRKLLLLCRHLYNKWHEICSFTRHVDRCRWSNGSSNYNQTSFHPRITTHAFFRHKRYRISFLILRTRNVQIFMKIGWVISAWTNKLTFTFTNSFAHWSWLAGCFGIKSSVCPSLYPRQHVCKVTRGMVSLSNLKWGL